MPRIATHPEQVFESVIIPLTRGAIAVVDFCDLDRVRPYGWFADDHGYAKAWTPWVNRVRRGVSMHRVVLGIGPDDPDVDHANGDKLDNRRHNLRLATVPQNLYNARKRTNARSRFKGVSWHPGRGGRGKWRPTSFVNGRTISLGLHMTEEEAAAAYDAFAISHFGEFARPNFPLPLHSSSTIDSGTRPWT